MNDKNLAPLDLIQILDRVYPVGTLYENKLDSRDPNIILGFGTWVAQTGFRVGKAASGTFATLGSTGGAETVTLDATQMPSHTHALNNNTLVNRNIAGSGGAQGATAVLGSTITIANTGGGLSHPNLPPYTVFAAWVRTA